MRSSLLQRGCVAAVVAVFAAVGWAAVAGATPGPGSQVAATTWTTTSAPVIGSESYDSGVSCVSSVFCVATTLADADTGTPNVQQWNGSSWQTVVLPAAPEGTDSVLESVSCTSVSFCVAVGAQSIGAGAMSLAYAWNGTSWSLSTLPALASSYTEAVLLGVSCTGPMWCVATGFADNSSTTTEDTYALDWNGTSWAVMTAPDIANHVDDIFNAVSCTGPSNCMAVGVNSVTGTGLDVPSQGTQPATGQSAQSGFPGLPDPLARAHALVPSARPHIAVTVHVLAEQWNGTAWTVTNTVDPVGITSPQLFAVSCAGTGFCMATGYNEESATEQGFAEQWSGGSWSPSALPAAPGGSDNALLGISCISPTSCTAVGTNITSVSNETILTGTWNGSTWTLGTVPTPSDPQAIWFGVSCLGGGECVATGGAENGTIVTPFNGQASIGRTGYRMVASDGGVFAYGPSAPALGAPYLGSMGGSPLNAPVVGTAVMPSGDGYDLVASDGGVFNFGSASFYGSTGSIHLNKPVVGMAMTADGGGYWLVAADGGIFNYGDAQFYGSTGGMHHNSPIVGMAPTPNGLGYFLVAADGGIFAYGNAAFAGSEGGKALNKPIVGMAVTPAGGYYLVASDGGIFTFNALFHGSTGGTPLNAPIVGMGVTGGGYYLVASDGGIFTYPGTGGPAFYGSAGGTKLSKPIVGIAA